MTTQKENRLYEIFVAIGFILATISYSIGSNIMETGYSAAAGSAAIGIGYLLELVNSFVVTAIGVLLFLRLRQYSKPITMGYMLFRIMEAGLLCAGGLMILTGVNESLQIHEFLFNLAMIILGIYSALFCIFLIKWSVGPKWLFTFGVVGYLTLAVYAGINLITAGESAPMWLFAPGAVFEVAFPIWLVTKGFHAKQP